MNIMGREGIYERLSQTIPDDQENYEGKEVSSSGGNEHYVL